MWDDIKAFIIGFLGIFIFHIDLNLFPVIEAIIQIIIGILTVIYLTLKIRSYATKSKQKNRYKR